MPMTQDRMRSLVEESERNLARMAHLRTLIEDIYNNAAASDRDKLMAIAANAREYLDGRDCIFTVLERERIKINWKRNEKTAERIRGLRARRAQGLPDLHQSLPRKPPTPRMIAPSAHPAALPPPITIEQAAMGNAQWGPLGPPPAYDDAGAPAAQESPGANVNETFCAPPDETLERELARAREIGAEEARKNAERLARDPFAQSAES